MDVLVLMILNLIIILTAVVLFLWILGRFAGKLKISMMFIAFSLVPHAIRNIIVIFNSIGVLTIINIRIANIILDFIFVILLICAIVSMKQMIDGIDNHYKKKSIAK